MTSIGPITFESGGGYSVNDYLGDETDWDDRELTTGTSGERARVDTHTDHKSGQVIDHSGKGSTINIHQTALAGANHSAQIAAFTDSMSGQGGGYDALGVWLRGSNNGSSATSGYIVSIRRTADGTDKTTLRIDYIVNDGSTNTNVYESSDISGTYSETAVHTLYAEVDGDDITIKVNGTTEATHDISGDAAQHDTGNYVGVVVEREYENDWESSNCQPFLDDFEAEDLAATGATVDPVASSSASSSATAGIVATVDVQPVASSAASSSDVASITATAVVQPVASSSASSSATTGITATAVVDSVGSSSTTATAVAGIVATTSVGPVASVSASSSDVAGITATTSVDASGSSSSASSAVAGITATTSVEPVGTVAGSSSAVANITTEITVDPTGSVSTSTSAVADITATVTAVVDTVGSSSSASSGTVDIVATVTVDASGSSSSSSSAIAGITTEITINPGGTVSASSSDVAGITATAVVAPVGTVSVSSSGTAGITATAIIDAVGSSSTATVGSFAPKVAWVGTIVIRLPAAGAGLRIIVDDTAGNLRLDGDGGILPTRGAVYRLIPATDKGAVAVKAPGSVACMDDLIQIVT